MPPESTMRYKIHQFSSHIINKIFQKINGLSVSLLIDGVEKSKKKYQGQILFTPKQIYFLGITKCNVETSENISQIIADTALTISRNGGHLVSVCTENFSSNIAALDGGPSSAQAKSKQNFFRTPCSCHTLNLAIKDIFDDKYKNIVTTVIHLLKYFKEFSEKVRSLGKIPEFKEIRWYSLSKCISFIIAHKIELDPLNLYQYDPIQTEYDWLYIDEILMSLKILMKKFEKNCFSIADIFSNLQITLNQLIKINELNKRKEEVNIAQDMLNSILKRFSSTENLKLPILAYLLTGYGLQNLNEKDQQSLISINVAHDTFLEYSNENPEKKNSLNFFYIF